MAKIDISDSDLEQAAKLLAAFAWVLERDDVGQAVARQLAEQLGDIGGARYADAGDSPMGPAFVARRAREPAAQLDAKR